MMKNACEEIGAKIIHNITSTHSLHVESIIRRDENMNETSVTIAVYVRGKPQDAEHLDTIALQFADDVPCPDHIEHSISMNGWRTLQLSRLQESKCIIVAINPKQRPSPSPSPSPSPLSPSPSSPPPSPSPSPPSPSPGLGQTLSHPHRLRFQTLVWRRRWSGRFQNWKKRWGRSHSGSYSRNRWKHRPGKRSKKSSSRNTKQWRRKHRRRRRNRKKSSSRSSRKWRPKTSTIPMTTTTTTTAIPVEKVKKIGTMTFVFEGVISG